MSVASIWMAFVRHIGHGPSQTDVNYKSILIACRFKQKGDDETKSKSKCKPMQEKSAKLLHCNNQKAREYD